MRTEKKNWEMGMFRMGAERFRNQFGVMGNSLRNSRKKNKQLLFSSTWQEKISPLAVRAGWPQPQNSSAGTNAPPAPFLPWAECSHQLRLPQPIQPGSEHLQGCGNVFPQQPTTQPFQNR